jgi:hypothetical protein
VFCRPPGVFAAMRTIAPAGLAFLSGPPVPWPPPSFGESAQLATVSFVSFHSEMAASHPANCKCGVMQVSFVTVWRSVGASVKKQSPTMFHCPNCQALYQLIKGESGAETVDREVTCRTCGGPLPGREGGYVLKYFLLRKSGRRQVWGQNRMTAN